MAGTIISKKNYFIYFAFFSALIASDQILKYKIRSESGFYICNKGIAWGIELPHLLFWFLWTGIIFLLFVLIYRAFQRKELTFSRYLAFTLILSGAISNLIDKLEFGCVTDFIDLKFWPIFNLADVFIVIGTIILLVKYSKS